MVVASALCVLGFPFCSLAQSSRVVDSLKLALSTTRNVEDSIRCLCQIAWTNAQADSASTLEYGMLALELSKRVQNNPERIAEAYDAAGVGYAAVGNLTKAKELHTEAARIGEQYNLPPRIAWGNYDLTRLSLQQGNVSEAMVFALKSRAAFKRLNNLRMIIYADWILLEDTKHYRRIYLDSTIEDYKSAERLTTDPAELLDEYMHLVHLYGERENKTQAMIYAFKAMEMAENINDHRTSISAYYQIGNYLRDFQHNGEIALLYYQRIENLCRADNADLDVASVLVDIGITQKLLGNDSLAFSSYYQSLAIADRLKHRHAQSDAYKNIGELHFQQGSYSQALDCLLKSYEIGCDRCPKIAFHSVLVDAGNVYLRARDYPHAQSYFHQSLLLADSAHDPNALAISRSALADFYAETKQPELALASLHAALGNARDAKSLSLQKDITLKLSHMYRTAGNVPKAYEYLTVFNRIADSLKVVSEADNLARLETKFEFQKVKLQNEAEISRQKQMLYLFISAFVFMTALGAIVFSGYRRKRRYSESLEEQKTQIEAMSKRVHEADEQKLNFFSNISHELRTPLTLILGPVEQLVKDHAADPVALPLLRIIRRNALQLHNLINQLLDIRKVDTGKMKLLVSSGNITEYCRGVYSTFLHIAEAQDLRYTFSAPTDAIEGWFSEQIVETSLNNLLSNAFKYTPRGGDINVSLIRVPTNVPDPARVRISVRDNGKGIPADQIQHVFDRYYQVENANTGFNTGTGIGLAFTRELVSLHKGEIEVESTQGQGTAFSITLPLRATDYSMEETVVAPEHRTVNDTGDIGHAYLEHLLSDRAERGEEEDRDVLSDNSPMLLIVEDNADVRAFVRQIFVDEFVVREAENGVEGFQIAVDCIPDIIISDIMMPGMNGLELCTRLKQTLQTNHIPVVMLTAKTGDANELAGLEIGADDYLTKPFNADILKARIHRLLEARKAAREYYLREFLLTPKEVVALSPEDEFVRRAVNVVEDHISHPDLGVEMLMRELAVSRTQLFRKLKAITGYSANQFIRDIKLKRAAQLLRQNRHSIAEVLYISGFNSPSYFSACFKEAYGCLPKEYAPQQANASIK
jgi:signal transduction histidine kinase/DNA-binding response OmpR family regulator